MRPGIYRDRDGNLVRVTRSEAGSFILTYPNGDVAVIGGAK